MTTLLFKWDTRAHMLLCRDTLWTQLSHWPLKRAQTMCTPTETHICPYLFTSNSKANTESALNVSSYQDQRTLHRKMLHAVEVWQSIQVQVSRAPSRPQALVWAAHLTHGCVAHGSTYISLFHQNVKDSKWVNHFDNPRPSSPSPKSLQATIQQDEVLSWLHHLTGRLCRELLFPH